MLWSDAKYTHYVVFVKQIDAGIKILDRNKKAA